MRLAQLLIHFRGFDLAQELTGLDLGADVHQPALQVTTGARVDRRLVVGLHVTRKHQLAQPRLCRGLGGRDIDHRLGLGNVFELGRRMVAGDSGPGNHDDSRSTYKKGHAGKLPCA